MEETPPSIEHDNVRRRTFIAANVRGRDVASFVNDAQRSVAQQVFLPPGFELRWGGDFENLQSASRRLLLITPIVLLLIFLLLQMTFRSVSLVYRRTFPRPEVLEAFAGIVIENTVNRGQTTITPHP